MKTDILMILYFILGFVLGVIWTRFSLINLLLKKIKKSLDEMKKQFGL